MSVEESDKNSCSNVYIPDFANHQRRRRSSFHLRFNFYEDIVCRITFEIVPHDYCKWN